MDSFVQHPERTFWKPFLGACIAENGINVPSGKKGGNLKEPATKSDSSLSWLEQ